MKTFGCFFKLSSARTSPRSSAVPAYLVAILLTLASFASAAQSCPIDSLAGSVRGIVNVIGPDGRSYRAPGAQVRLIAATRDASRLAVADASGQYKFDSVRRGSYQLEVALDSFERVAKPITIRAGETTVENVNLEVKGVREVSVKAERVDLNLRDAGPAPEINQQALQTVLLVNERFRGKLPLNVKGAIASHGGLAVNNTVASYSTFNLDSSQHLLSAPNQTIHLPRFFALEMQVLKSFHLRVSPKVRLGSQNHDRRPQFPDVQTFYPQDFQGNLTSTNSGIFSNGAGRMFGMRFVIEKK